MTCLRVTQRDGRTIRSVVLSDETPAIFRHRLDIVLDGSGPPLGFLLHNPSRADHELDDATFVRVIGFARREQARRAVIMNPAGYRTDDPRDLRSRHEMGFDVFGPDNLPTVRRALLELADDDGRLVLGWGVVAGRRSFRTSFSAAIVAILDVAAECELPLLCLGMNADSSPRHPLYLAAATPLVPWECRS